jgi:hypothetical protein
MTLRLLESAPPPPPAFEVAPIELRRHPTRPSVTHVDIELELPIDLARGADELAAEEGLATTVWVALVIESERAVRRACGNDSQADELRDRLDELARTPVAPVPGGAARLGAFGKALRGAGSDAGPLPKRPVAIHPERLSARAPYQALTAWRDAAIGEGQRLDEWAAERLRWLPRGRFLWEASAAERGETLAEWVLAQAARR